MLAMELNGIEIDHCIECFGTWLDRGEIEAIADRAGSDRTTLARAIMTARRGNRTADPCPRCRRKLVHIHFDGPPLLTLDRCPIGHGLWFDRGELITLIKAYAGGAAAPVASFFADLYRSELEHAAEGEA